MRRDPDVDPLRDEPLEARARSSRALPRTPGTRSRPARRRCPCTAERCRARRRRRASAAGTPGATTPDVRRARARAARGRARSVRSVVDESSMSIRTKLPRAAASPTTASRFSRHRSRSSSSPSPVSFTEMFASSPSASIAREHVVVLAGDRARLVRARDLLAEDVDRRQLPFRVQLANDAQRVVEGRSRDVARREPLHDGSRDRRQEADDARRSRRATGGAGA